MLPLLRLAGDQKEHQIRDAIEALALVLRLTDDDRAERLPSGTFKFDDRVHWANTYLKKAGFVKSTGRGLFRITDRGQEALRASPSTLTVDELKKFSEFVDFIGAKKDQRTLPTQQKPVAGPQTQDRTPQEILDSSYNVLRDQLAQDLLEYVRGASWRFFEKLVVDLLLALGYGGLSEDSGKVIGQSGDGGIDGIITEDKLGFDAVCVQAKKWGPDSKVGRPTVQQFAGSLLEQGVSKGVLITTSGFSTEAVKYVSGLKQPKIVLIDGIRLAELMIDHNVGIIPDITYVIKRVDKSYFE